MENRISKYDGSLLGCLGEWIISITFNGGNGPHYELGQVVYSNGRLWVRQGTLGIVTQIKEPGSHGHSSNVIGIQFVGVKDVLWMKTKDLQRSEHPVRS